MLPSPTADDRVGIFPFRQEHELQLAGARQYGKCRVDGLPRRTATCLVAVETAHHDVHMPVQRLEVRLADGGSQRGDTVDDAVLGKRHHVHVALDHEHVLQSTLSAACLVESVELASLAEDIRLGGVDVLGLALPVHAPPEADDAAAGVANGEDDAFTEPVVRAAVLVADHQSGGDQLLLAER